MQQYLTLEEAAKRLQMSPDELREMAKKKTIRAFQDRGSWRFRTQDIDELARTRGLTSDPELPLNESPKPKKTSGLGKKAPEDSGLLAVDFKFDDDDSDEVALGNEKPSAKSGPRSSKSSSRLNPPKPGSDSDVRLVLDGGLEFDIDLDSDVKVESPSPKPKPGGRKSKLSAGDSGVRLVPPDDSPDSEVKLEPSGKDSGKSKKNRGPSDSDIRLEDLPSSSGKRDGNIITEEIDLDAEEAKANKPAKGTKHKGTQMANKSVLPTSSPFELSDSDLDMDEAPPAKKKPKSAPKMRSETDSSSDFELIPFDAAKSPGDLGSGEIPLLDDDEVSLGSEVSGQRSGESGINLQPKDSGISLEDGGSDELDLGSDFELSLDSGATPKPEKPSKSQKKKAATEDSSSEFELSLEDDEPSDASSEFELSLEDSDEQSGVDDIGGSESEFELTLDEDESGSDDEDLDVLGETNFEVPALEDEESGSEAMALDSEDTNLEDSDFEISLDDDLDSDSDTGEESGSQVVSLDDEDAEGEGATVAKPRRRKSQLDMNIENEPPIDEDSDFDVNLDAPEEEEEAKPAKKPAKSKKPVAVAEEEEDEDTDEDESEEPVGAAAPAEWGALPAVLLLPTVIVLFVVGIMGYELLRGMWGYHRPSVVGKPVIDNVARMFDDKMPK